MTVYNYRSDSSFSDIDSAFEYLSASRDGENDALLKDVFPPLKISYALEFAYQFGKYGTNDIENAYAIHADLKRKFDAFLKPELLLEYNNASGNKDPSDVKTNTFISYYQTTHAPYGLMDFFRWQNMREISLSLKLNLNQKMRIMPSINCFWLDEKKTHGINQTVQRSGQP